VKLTLAIIVALIVVAVGRSALYERTAFEKPPKVSVDWKAKYQREHRLRERLIVYSVRIERDRNRWKRIAWRKPSVTEALNLACAVYGNCATLWRRAKCETGGTLNPRSRNKTAVGNEHATGLVQFLPSTFRSTPFARFDIYSPYANALAGAWMMGPAGRGGEWTCR
jgi:hypothetical protein